MKGIFQLSDHIKKLTQTSEKMSESTTLLNDNIKELIKITSELINELKVNTKARKMLSKVCSMDKPETKK